MVTALAIDRTNSSVYYAAFGGYEADNLYRSANAGATWTNIHGTLPAMPIRAIAIHPGRASWLYVGAELGVFTSENTGASWNTTTDGPANVSVDDLFFVGTGTLYAFTHGRGAWRVPLSATGGQSVAVQVVGWLKAEAERSQESAVELGRTLSSTATPHGLSAPVMKDGFAPEPSRFARPMVLLKESDQ